MQTAFGWAQDLDPAPQLPTSKPAPQRAQLPPSVEAALWRGDELGAPVIATLPSGWRELDAELPGGGWGCHAVTEVLSPQDSVLEWRLLAPALKPIVAAGQQIVIVGPPERPHLPGIVQAGIDQRHLVWIDVDTPADRLWATEQLIKGASTGALLSWLPHVRAEQIRRLQVAAHACAGPVFLLRPENARHEASAAPLRALATLDVDWALRVQILKRRGPVHDGEVVLPSVPSGIESVLTPRLRRPSDIIAHRGAVHAVDRATPAARRRRFASVS